MTRLLIKKIGDGKYAVHRRGERLIVAEIIRVQQGYVLQVWGNRIGDYHATLEDAKAAIFPAIDESRIVA